MSEKTKKNNDQEDELNQSRFQAERGAEVAGTVTPTADGIAIEEEDIMDSKSRFRESPGSIDQESNIADKSPLYGQGFEAGDDTDIRRTAEKSDPKEKGSLGI